MTIAFDATYFTGTSGIETYSRNLVRALAATAPELQCILVTTKGKKEDVQERFPAQPNIYVADGLPHPLMLGRIGQAIVRKMRNRAWKKIAGVVNLVHFTDPLHVVPALRNAVVTVHDVIPMYGDAWSQSPAAPHQRAMLKHIMRDARRIVVPSQFVRDELMRLFRIGAQRITVIQEAAEKKFRVVPVNPEVLERAGILPGEKYFFCVGRLDPRKNLAAVIEAFAQLAPDLRSNTRLVIAGHGTDAEMHTLEQRAKKFGLGDRVALYTSATDDDLVHLYNGAVALVFASLSEGFGLPAVEAMQCGCPVIASNGSSLPEVTSGAALQVDELDIASIAAAMQTMLTDPSVRTRCRTNGLLQSKKFSWERAARETIAVYQELLNNRA